jgi:hypothetical protein
MSCRGRSQHILAFAQKKLETMRAAQKLFGAPAIGGGSARAGGGGLRELKEAIKPPCWLKCTKTAPKTGGFPHVLALKSLKTPFFAQK